MILYVSGVPIVTPGRGVTFFSESDFFQRSAGDVRVGPTLFRLARLYARARAEWKIPGRERNRPDFMPFGPHSSTGSRLY